MNEEVLQEIGGLRADVRTLIRTVDRLADRLDDHAVTDERRFTALETRQARDEGAGAEREKTSALRRWLFQAATTGIPGAIAGYSAALFGHK